MCEACTSDAAEITEAELKELMLDLPDWQLRRREDLLQLEKTFTFNNFIHAIHFANKVADLAEEHDHHPAILTEWGKATITWWTHSIHGLHRNDFIMAAKTDAAYLD